MSAPTVSGSLSDLVRALDCFPFYKGMCFPLEAWGWLDISQDHCASQSVGWGLGWTSSLPSAKSEGLALNAGQPLASLASLGLGEK